MVLSGTAKECVNGFLKQSMVTKHSLPQWVENGTKKMNHNPNNKCSLLPHCVERTVLKTS
jgi:hypothetical protein